MMQIRELVLYGYNGKVRHLPFVLGQVNIITGRAKSGNLRLVILLIIVWEVIHAILQMEWFGIM